jgi:hypothetical protein
MDLVKRNAQIVALVKAGKIPRRKIAARYRLSVTSISQIAMKHGVCVRTPDPQKVRLASELINRGMPLTHVAQPWASTSSACVTFLSRRAFTRRRRQMESPGVITR